LLAWCYGTVPGGGVVSQLVVAFVSTAGAAAIGAGAASVIDRAPVLVLEVGFGVVWVGVVVALLRSTGRAAR
jgi:hypothetical protein